MVQNKGMFICVASGLLMFICSQMVAAQDDAQHQLSAFVTHALQANPRLEAVQAAIRAARAQLAESDKPLYNPELEVNAEHASSDTYTLGISQTLDWSDKREGQVGAAQLALDKAQAQAAALRLELVTELLRASGEVVNRKEIQGLAENRSNLLERLAELARQRHTAGDISLSELELARLSLAEAAISQAGSGAELIRARSDFWRICNLSPDTIPKLPGDLPPVTELDQELENLAGKHPQVRVGRLTTQLARQQVQVADLERRADPSIGLRGGREDQDTLVGLTLSLPLQVRNDHRAQVDAARAEALQAEQEAMQAYRDALARLRAAKERYTLLRNAWSNWSSQGSLSLQRRMVILESQWRAGEMSTTDYLLQVRQTLDTEIAGITLEGDLWDAWVEWLGASGTLEDWMSDLQRSSTTAPSAKE